MLPINIERRHVIAYVFVLQLEKKDAKFLLRLTDLNLHDVGNYTCIVSNKYGKIEWNYELEVIG